MNWRYQESTWYRVQSNDWKDTHWIQEKNRWTQWGLQQRGRKHKIHKHIPNRNGRIEHNIWTEKKITLERFNSRLDKAEGHISKLKDRAMGLTQKEHMSVHTHTHTHADTFWGNIKWNNICIIWVPEGRKRRVENLLEEIWQNIPNLEKKTDIKVQEAQRIQNKMNLKNSAIRHNIIKISKVKEF